VDITGQWVRKRQALEAYAAEMRPWPHARSIEALEHLARWRGAQVGVEAAEAFCLLRGLR
jgi:LmbE family N-acetylglucosaminyl deacetylase